jgi:LAO/AO transport system kinase
MEIYGAEYIFIETVGIGQSEIDVASQADTVVLVVVPGMGDDIQAEKAGILEVSDVIAVNKADHDDTDRTIKQLKSMLGLRMDVDSENPLSKLLETDIIPTIATTGEGVVELMVAIELHQNRRTEIHRTPDMTEKMLKEELKSMIVTKIESDLIEFETETLALTESASKILKQQIDLQSEIQLLIDEYIKWRKTKC